MHPNRNFRKDPVRTLSGNLQMTREGITQDNQQGWINISWMTLYGPPQDFITARC